MYGGKVAEYASADQIYNHAQHPYTQRLLASFPDIHRPAGALASIPGTPPRLTDLPTGCRFEPRCHVKLDKCTEIDPAIVETEDGHFVACHLCAGKASHFA